MQRLALPHPLKGIFFHAVWDKAKVWALPTPVTTLSLDQLEWQLALTVWSTVAGQARFDLSPSLVLSSPNEFARHWTRIGDADLTRPLELFEKHGAWIIIDGYHRLARHWLRSSPHVPVRLHPAAHWRLVRAV